jgi:type II restriction enzyme
MAVRAFVSTRWKPGEVFSLSQVYASVELFQKEFPRNMHVREKLRQVLQELREDGFLDFLDDDGHYRRVP